LHVIDIGAKFRYRIAYNLAKECLLGKEHIPSKPQEDLLIKKISMRLSTFRDGWHGLQKPQTNTHDMLDALVSGYIENRLQAWKHRSVRNATLKNAALTPTFKVSYFPGVDMKPSNWIKKEAINDVLHEHLCALEARCLIASSKDKIDACEKDLKKIHERWVPDGSNCFFASFDLYSSEYGYIDMLKSIRAREGLKKIEKEGGLTTTVLDKVIAPKKPIDIYDFFSPASVCQFLAAIPISNNITKHSLLDFWIMEFASSVLVVQGLIDGFYWKNSETFQTPKEMEDILTAGYELFWGESDVKVALMHLNIHSSSIFYDEYYKAFSLFRTRYAEILNEFGISVAELQDVFNEYTYREFKEMRPKKHSKPFEKSMR
jgi:hypothetical protein